MINSTIIAGRIATIYKENPNATWLRVAVTDAYKKTTFIPCVAFSHTKKFLDKYFQKGKWIAIQGHISVLEEGDNTRINVIIETANFIGAKATDKNHQGENVNNEPSNQISEGENADEFTPMIDDIGNSIPILEEFEDPSDLPF